MNFFLRADLGWVFNPSWSVFFLRVARLGRRGGGWGEGVPAANNSKAISDKETKIGRIVENHRLINLMLFNWLMTSSLSHNDVINAKIFSFRKIFLIKVEQFRDVSD